MLEALVAPDAAHAARLRAVAAVVWIVTRIGRHQGSLARRALRRPRRVNRGEARGSPLLQPRRPASVTPIVDPPAAPARAGSGGAGTEPRRDAVARRRRA